MAQPTKPTVPPAPLRSQPDTFSTRAEASLVFWDPFATYMDEVGTFTDEKAGEALAAALGGDLPPLTGHALKFMRVNAGETAAEFSAIEGFLPLAGGTLTGAVTLDVDDLDALILKGRVSDDITQLHFQRNDGTFLGIFRSHDHVDFNFSVRDSNNVQAYTFADTGSIAPRSDTVLNRAMGDTRYALADSSPIKAWVNFNGTGVVAIIDDFNVLGITDHGPGQYTVTYDNALANANYSVSGVPTGTNATSNNNRYMMNVTGDGAGGALVKTTAALRISVVLGASGVFSDVPSVSVQIIGN